MFVKIIAVAIITIIISSLVKNVKSNFYVLVNVCGGIIIFYIILQNVTTIFSDIDFIGPVSKYNSNILPLLIKIICFGYITEFACDIAEDSGNKFISSRLLLGGKIAICLLILPIIKNLFIAIISLL